MVIIRGRGNKRKVLLSVPHPSIIKRSEEREQIQFIGLVCNILGVENKK